MNQDVVTVAQLPEFAEIVDVRSPAEYAIDHIPGAINCPVLDNEERARIGTLYVQVSPFTAKRLGAAWVARNIARHVEERFADKPKSWRPLVYCWRGGQRSAAMAHVLRQIGWDAKRLSGGYKAYRRLVVADIESLALRFSYRVLCGLTGSGKSALLHHLELQGAQALDLEQLAAHRGSLLGSLPGESQPSQKMFESRIWQKLKNLDAQRPLFVESESRKIGNLCVPEALIACMWQSECVWLETPTPLRVELLLRDYRHFTEDAAGLGAKLDCLLPLYGKERILEWKALIAAGSWRDFVARILEQHYDRAYSKSTTSHYARLQDATRVQLCAPGEAYFQQLAGTLLQEQNALVPG